MYQYIFDILLYILIFDNHIIQFFLKYINLLIKTTISDKKKK